MKVVIVAKTRQRKGACIGALTFQGESLRLIAADANWNETAGLEYNVGQVWEIDGGPAENIVPPHVENFIVQAKRLFPPIDDPVAFIDHHMTPHAGGLQTLYEGLTQATKAGALYIAERTGTPSYSTTFWIPDRPLRREDDAKRIRYRYPTIEGGRTLTFVGFQEPLEEIPAGTHLRVSLAHWWRPEDMNDGELRCYVQLSGWLLPQEERYDHDPQEMAIESKRSPLTVGSFASMDGGPDLTTAAEILRDVFGYERFLPTQGEVIANILAKRDTLAVMPTGGGKSLCYQLPALMFSGLTVVVAPLISLMQDQVDQLEEWDIPAVFLNSTLSYSDYLRTAQKVREGAVKLLYIAPETLLRPETLVLLDQSQVSCLAIDEAHCISAWGHDFRPVYRELADVRRRFSQAVCFALTATATARVREDIIQSLAIPLAGEFIASFNRENLFLAVETKSDAPGQLLAFLETHRNQAGIIYCATRKQVERLASFLVAQGWPALPYHAGLENDVRLRHQRHFSHDQTQIIVATIAFGMGIDKSNVRFVIHYDLPKDIESYYQEIGRAGRDGLRADCLLLYGLGDTITIRRFNEEKSPKERRRAELRLLALSDYAEAATCRRQIIMRYFGETFESPSCGMCDICLSERIESDDITIPAQMFLSCVKRTDELFGVTYIIDVLRGSRQQRILNNGHDRIPTHGKGRAYSAKQWRQLAGQFTRLGLLTRDPKYGGLKMTTKAYDVFKGKKVMGKMSVEGGRATAPAAAGYDADLFELLRGKRTELATAGGVPPYVIFSDRSLADMAANYPQSAEAFARMHGVGQVKLEKHAGDFLPLIRVYCQARGIDEKIIATENRKRDRSIDVKGFGLRTLKVVAAYQDGRSIDSLVAELGVQQVTVVKHLRNYIEAGNTLPPAGFLESSSLPSETQSQILAAFEEHGSYYLRPAFDALEGTVSYDELRIMQLYYMSR